MLHLHLNFMLAGTIAALCYYFGVWVKDRVRFLKDFCIPEAVVGGLTFAFIKFFLFHLGIVEITFDKVLQFFFMTMFFTSVGFGASIKNMRIGGNALIRLGIVCGVLIVLQNVLSIAITKALGQNALLGLCTGSMPLVGGHGSAGVFGPMLEEIGVRGALATAMTMSTFGLIMGGLVGGPVAGRLIAKYKLRGRSIKEEFTADDNCDTTVADENELEVHTTGPRFMKAFSILLFCMGIGSVISDIVKMYGIMVPPYLGSIIIAAIIRNLESNDVKSFFRIPAQEIALFADLALNIFLSMTLMALNIWELKGLLGPIAIIALAQMTFISIYSYFVVFRVLGKNYNAALISAAVCGFGLGAIPTAMANMQSITKQFGVAAIPFLLVPIIGSMVDGINASVIVLFMNCLK